MDTILTQQPDSRYVVLKRKMTYDEKKPYDDFLASEDENDAQKIKAVSSGIWFEESYQRIYPFSTLACDLIGFTASDNSGLWGIESYYNVHCPEPMEESTVISRIMWISRPLQRNHIMARQLYQPLISISSVLQRNISASS